MTAQLQRKAQFALTQPSIALSRPLQGRPEERELPPGSEHYAIGDDIVRLPQVRTSPAEPRPGGGAAPARLRRLPPPCRICSLAGRENAAGRIRASPPRRPDRPPGVAARRGRRFQTKALQPLSSGLSGAGSCPGDRFLPLGQAPGQPAGSRYGTPPRGLLPHPEHPGEDRAVRKVDVSSLCQQAPHTTQVASYSDPGGPTRLPGGRGCPRAAFDVSGPRSNPGLSLCFAAGRTQGDRQLPGETGHSPLPGIQCAGLGERGLALRPRGARS